MDVSHNEALTRKLKIDKQLEAAGWKVVPYKEGQSLKNYNKCAVTEYPTANGPADYVLVYDEQPLAIIEAKKGSVGAYTVLEQAKRYAKGIKANFLFGEYKVPFIYSADGEETYFQDLRDRLSYSRKVYKFHTLEAVMEMLSSKQSEGRKWLQTHKEMNSKARDYQIEAINSIEDALAKQKRTLMLAMATGTGKTFTMAMQVYRLMASGYAKRILFLVDRRSLAAQAVREFSTYDVAPGQKFDKVYEVYSQRFRKEDFEDEKFDANVLPTKYLTDPKPGLSFVYICTIQRMRINLFGKEGAFEEEDGDPSDIEAIEQLDIPINAFDVVIADECHRGYTATEISKWREVLDYFDAIKIGLTATPAAHTTAYFNDIVFRYDYQRAVREGYLVDYEPIAIKSDVKLNGIFLKENELIGIVDSERGREKLDKIEDERGFEATKVEREITSPDSTKKIITELSRYLFEQEKLLGHFPKTLIFAVNDVAHISHADRIIKTCREVFERGDAFVQKITGSPTVDRPLQKIREFRNRPEPAIVVTVDMLSTGVDIPALENIVFLRPVKSRILFTQMLGRGTRKCDAISKDHFTVFDCFGGSLLEYFEKVTDFTIEPPDKPTRSNEEIINDIYKNKDRKYNVNCLVKRFQRISKSMSGEALESFAEFIPEGDIGRFAKELPEKIESDFVNTIKLLRNQQFQELLADYPRKSKSFIIAYETKDVVISEKLFRTMDGKEIKAADYIEAFSDFVKKNSDKIEAIKILLKRPSGWNTKVLYDLRKELQKNPYKFTEEKLRKAYNYELADIISIIKHAAKDEPLISSQERVERAILRFIDDKKLTDEQQKWLGLIKEHLIWNLTIDEGELETAPIFVRQGGLKVANRVFGGNVKSILKELNEEVAK
jgi:type I restriction enzyme R subunit